MRLLSAALKRLSRRDPALSRAVPAPAGIAPAPRHPRRPRLTHRPGGSTPCTARPALRGRDLFTCVFLFNPVWAGL